MNKDLVIGMGEVLWDVLPDGKKLGGAPCNFAYHVSQFGIPSCAISAIGDDPLGKEIIKNLDDKGVKYHIDAVPYPTGTVIVELDMDGVPQYEIKEMWHGTTSPIPKNWKVWPNAHVLSVSVLWPNAMLFHATPSISFLMPFRLKTNPL